MRLQVKDIMTAEPVTVRPDLPFKEVVDLLIERDIGGLPVVDDDGALVGIVTESDLITKPAFRDKHRGFASLFGALLGARRPAWLNKAAGLTAREIMSEHVLTAAPSEDLEPVARRMVEHRIGRLPVLEDGRLVGIVSRRDLLRPFHRTDDEIAADVEKALGDRVTFEYGHHVTFSINEGIVTLTGTVTFPHEIETLRWMVGGVPGVVEIHNEVTAEQPEPRIEPPTAFPGGYTRLV
jgi:CBS domain-containing protein